MFEEVSRDRRDGQGDGQNTVMLAGTTPKPTNAPLERIHELKLGK